jgi:hypothetical protein
MFMPRHNVWSEDLRLLIQAKALSMTICILLAFMESATTEHRQEPNAE